MISITKAKPSHRGQGLLRTVGMGLTMLMAVQLKR
jgi:hypothetical protein